MSGPVGILGCPGSGKTTLARRLAVKLIDRTGIPLLVVDTGQVDVFDDMPHVYTVKEACLAVWGEGRHVAFTPRESDAFERLCGAVYGAHAETPEKPPAVILLVDELKNVVPPGQAVKYEFRRCLSEHRRVLAGCFVTSQLYSDVGRSLKGLATEWYIHRMPGPDDQRDLRADYGLDPAVLAALPSAKECAQRGESPDKAYVHLRVGF